jgi:hypothetical protein
MQVYIMLFNPTGYNTVVPLEAAIADKVLDYIYNSQHNPNPKGEWNFQIPSAGASAAAPSHSWVNFTINNYDSVANDLKGKYEDFYLLSQNPNPNSDHNNENDNDNENEKINIVSCNEEKLKAFCGFINRLTN